MAAARVFASLARGFAGAVFFGFSGVESMPPDFSRASTDDLCTMRFLPNFSAGMSRPWRSNSYTFVVRQPSNSPATWADPLGLAGLDFPTLMNMAQNTLDFSTARDGAVFWSGPNMPHAQAWAAANGKTTLEQTTGGKFLASLNLFDAEQSERHRDHPPEEKWSAVREIG